MATDETIGPVEAEVDHDPSDPPDEPAPTGLAWRPVTLGLTFVLAAFALRVEQLPQIVGDIDHWATRMALIIAALLCWCYAIYHSERKTTEKVAMAVGVAVLHGCLMFLAAFYEADPVVPDVTGFQERNAGSILNWLEVSVRATMSEEADTPADEVVAQDIRPGNRSDDVVLTISAGPPPPVLPDLLDMDLEEAQAKIAALDISIDLITGVAGRPGFRVVGMAPAAGEASDRVALTVTNGSPAPEMPRLFDLREDEALAILDETGIEVIVVRERSTQNRGVVIGQDPPVGVEVIGVATVTVSSGPGTPTVPAVVGLSLDEATARVAAAGVDLVTTREPSNEVPVGVVIKQLPVAEARADSVELTVSAGPDVGAAFAGMWLNVDEDTAGLTRLDVDGSGTAVNGFGACVPTDCDWETATASIERGVLRAEYDFGFKTSTLSAVRAGPLLLVEVTSEYVEGDDRIGRVDNYTLATTAPDQIPLDELEVLATSDLQDELVLAGAYEHVPQLALIVATSGDP